MLNILGVATSERRTGEDADRTDQPQLQHGCPAQCLTGGSRPALERADTVWVWASVPSLGLTGRVPAGWRLGSEGRSTYPFAHRLQHPHELALEGTSHGADGDRGRCARHEMSSASGWMRWGASGSRRPMSRSSSVSTSASATCGCGSTSDPPARGSCTTMASCRSRSRPCSPNPASAFEETVERTVAARFPHRQSCRRDRHPGLPAD